MFALYSFKKLEFFEQVGKIHYFRAGSIKRAGRNFEQNSINEQVLIRASRLENDQNFLVRACSLNRHTRVPKNRISFMDVPIPIIKASIDHISGINQGHLEAG